MKHFVVLDTSVLGLLTHPQPSSTARACLAWVADLRAHNGTVVLPEIADYEMRRDLLRRNAHATLRNLDVLCKRLLYQPVNTPIMRQAAIFWAQARQQGQPTAPDHALDGDVILAAHAVVLNKRGGSVVVATANIRHLQRYVDARAWQAIVPGQW